MPKAIVSVTNDTSTDQRVDKTCNVLTELGYDVLLIGRLLQHRQPVCRNYAIKRFKLLFNKGFLFYAEYNLRLFLFLLTRQKDLLLANDLDTLLPNYIVHKLQNKKLIYDSHELFTEVPELVIRPRIRKFWLALESYIMPKLKNVITVNRLIKSIYEERYGISVHVVRNIAPPLKNSLPDSNLSHAVKGSRKMLILQGSGINKDRGAEEAVLMMTYLNNAILYIIGGGDVFNNLKILVKKNQLEDKVFLIDKLPYRQLMEYTKIADLGLSLDKNTNLNYEFSLPNKIFDYLQAGIPMAVSSRKLVAEIIKQHDLGIILPQHNPIKMAEAITLFLNDKNRLTTCKNNVLKAQEIYCWSNEKQQLIQVLQNLR